MVNLFWVVWNESKERCDFPTKKHFSLTEANNEAERLAKLHEGQTFSVLQLRGSVKTLTVQWEFPEDLPF